MGQKVNPNGFRLGGVIDWKSNWFVNKKVLSAELLQDRKIKKYLESRISARASISKVSIERIVDKIFVYIHCVKIGVILGKDRAEIYSISNELKKLIGCAVLVNVIEVKNPDLNSVLIMKNISSQLHNRMPYKRVIRMIIQKSMKAGARGVKVQVSGRLNGADIARCESFSEGSIPLQTLRANIDYACGTSQTMYGILGLKVWLFRDEVFGNLRAPILRSKGVLTK
ncbi:MAG: 30S ribosomal protein S3 [Phocaeicola sp.]